MTPPDRPGDRADRDRADRDRAVGDLLSRTTFPVAGTEVTCAVSGGADSLALLVLAASAGCRVTAIHVDHGLREGSGAEAEVVAAAARRFGAAFRSERVHVQPGPNLEARLRTARYGVLPADVLTGHTADDQAETVLAHLFRGAGLTGLAAMSPQRHPLLGVRRSETHALCASLGLTPVADPSNDSPAHRRNRIRHELLPLAGEVFERDVVPLLVRAAALARDEADVLDSLSEALDPTDAAALTAAPVALARRAVRRWLTPALGGYPPDRDAVERVLAVAAGDCRACELPHGWRVSRRHQRLRLEPPAVGP